MIAPGERIRISSKLSFVVSRIWPLLWFGFFFVFLIYPQFKRDPSFSNSVLQMYLLFAVAALSLSVYQYRNMASEVLDDGNSLWVKKSGRMIEVPLSTILSVSMSRLSNAGIVIVNLKGPSDLGTSFRFMLPAAFTPGRFAYRPEYEALLIRVHELNKS
jgi:hypothetical protein